MWGGDGVGESKKRAESERAGDRKPERYDAICVVSCYGYPLWAQKEHP